MSYRLILIAALLVACGGGGTNTQGDSGATPDLSSAPPDLSPPPTYASFAKNFFTTYCVRCHPSAQSARDFTQYAVIQQNAHNIMCGVSPTALPGCSGNPAPAQFPIGTGPFPSDAERDELVAWIQAGLPQ